MASDDQQITFSLPKKNSEQVINENSVSDKPINTNKVVSRITREIGTGDDAKHSIIWTTIRWSFLIALGITLLLLVFLGFAYYNNNQSEISELKKFILSIWAVFTPIITLSLGYAFGKDYK